MKIEIYKWDESTTAEGVALYCTLGASTCPIKDNDPSHRVEFFIGLIPARDTIASAFAALGLYAKREGVVLDHWHTVSAGAPLWEGSGMRTFLVVRPKLGFMAPLESENGLHVHFLQAIPIFESERVFVSGRGVEALLDRWAQDGVPFWSPDRDDSLSLGS